MRRLVVVPLLLALGCPSSEDVLLVPDAGLGRLDIVLPGADVARDDFGQPIPSDDAEAPVDTGGGCVTPADCDLEAGLCQVVRCTDGQCVLDQAPDGAACADDDACTETECTAGQCVTVAETVCEDDGNPCTSETCKKDSGCSPLPVTGQPCDDGDPCTVDDLCTNGVCGGTLSCDLGSADNPAASCLALHEADATKPSGVYYVKAGAEVVTVYCDMTTNGGGWTRVGVVDGTLPLCNLTAGLGTAAAVQNGTGTAFLPVATVSQIAGQDGLVMGKLTQGATSFTMTFSSVQWAAIADGTVNTSNGGSKGLKVSIDGGTAEALTDIPVAASFKGAAMLGGKRPSGKYTFIFGVGAQKTGAFAQNAACTALTTEKGLWGGDSFAGFGKWGISGSIFVR